MWNSSSSEYTLAWMTGFTAVFVPLILWYTSWAFWVMRGKVSAQTHRMPTSTPTEEPLSHGDLSHVLSLHGHRRCVIVMAIILGAYGVWYFAWLIGTVMMVLIAAAGAAMLDAQEEERRRSGGG